MTLALAFRALASLVGALVLARAVARRVGRSATGRLPDPAATLGLRLLAGAGAAFVVGAAAAPLHLALGDPRWVAVVGDRLLVAALVVAFPLAAWLGWRLSAEEFDPPADSPAPSDRDRVT